MVLAAVGLLIAMAVRHGRPARGADAAATANPHWSADGCANCHAMPAGQPSPIPVDKIDALCLTCHDGTRAGREVHPIGRLLDEKRFNHPKDFPLIAGRVGCVTCHDVKQACRKDTGRPDFNPTMLRGLKPDAESQNFCNTCHKPQNYVRFNPHIMVAPNRRDILDDRCLFCHESLPARDAKQRTGQPSLRSDLLLLCRSCHPFHKEIFKGGHIGVHVPDEIKTFMRAREIVGLMSTPSDDLLEQLKAQKAAPTLMPLSASGDIQCTTCHNPHQYGVFGSDSTLGHRAMRLVSGKTVSPVHNDAWCKHCHANL